jgi:chromosome segregation ATPase
LVETEAQVLRGKVNTLQGDHNELNLTINDIKQKLSQVELSLKEMQRATDEKERHIKDLTEDARIEKERLQKYAKTQQSMLKKEVHMIMEQKRNIEVELEESHMSFQTFRRDAITAEERNQREFQLALNELVVKNATLEETTTTLQNDLLLKEMESECSIQNLKQALEMCQQEARKTMKVKQSLQSEVKLLEEISKSLKDELLEARRKLEHLVDECNKKELELDESDTKIRDLTVYHDLILSQLDAQTKELSKERMTTKRAEKEARESAEKSDALVQKEKRKTDAFKQKALEAQALNVHTKQLLKKMSNEAN